jgi:hypothetical protein
MRFRQTLFAIIILGATAAQADYRAEISTSLGGSTVTKEYDDVGPNYEEEDETGHFDIEATVYLAPVQTANVPLGEAVFLSKASFASLYVSRDDVEHNEDNNYEDYDYDVPMSAIGGRFVVPNVDLIFEAKLGSGEEDGDGTDGDLDLRGLGFGSYIGDRISLVLTYDELEFDYGGTTFKDKIWQLIYTQYIPLSGETALAIEPYLTNYKYESGYSDKDAVALGVAVKFYINHQLDVYIEVEGYRRDDSDYEESRGSSSVGIDYFINEQFKIGAALNSVTGEGQQATYYEGYGVYDRDFDIEGGGIEVNAAVRF